MEKIIAISAGGDHSLGLQEDGRVVATGSNLDHRCDVETWDNIIQISAGSFHSVGLRKDGTVVAVGSNIDGRCNVES